MKKVVFALALMAVSSSAAFSQADSTISRVGDLQLGGGYVNAQSDYLPTRIRGFMFYGDFDFREHYGIEFDFHQASDPGDSHGTTNVYERTYEVGPRYVRHYGRFAPYGKILIGRGVFNFPKNEANLAYNMYGLGGGLDVSVHRKVNVRIDYEYQSWHSFPPNGLTPSLISIGVAYHFGGGPLSTR